MVGLPFLCFIALFCTSVIAELTNYTIDDASPSMVYGPSPILQCNTDTCPASTTKLLFNGTSTFTQKPTILSFTGSAIYVFMDVSDGGCVFTIDGDDVGFFNTTSPDGSIELAYHNTSMPAGSHVLLISPAHPESLIELDYIIYTADVQPRRSPRKVHVGAIVGGVIGAVLVTVGLIVGAFFLRRRDERRKLFIRGVPLGDDDKASINLKMLQLPKK
ncbi:hypothetical protein B0H19DRAFT_1103389 [Mycena capillaripes]|nr:hypothetical protein B0H19DRAFT_1103389 [Mycena capillaripes]